MIPDSVTHIQSGAFYECTGLEKLVIPASVTNIEAATFENCNNLTIYCYRGSAAAEQAIKNNIKYVYIDAIPDTPDEPITPNTPDEPVTPNTPDEPVTPNTPDEPVTPNTPDTPDEPIKVIAGDIDGDGKVTAKDSLKLQRIVIKLDKTEIALAVADVNGDGRLDNRDSLDILRYSIGLNVNSDVGKIVEL